MKKGNKKETMKPMTVQDVTTEIFEHCKEQKYTSILQLEKSFHHHN